jgi:hypothetical protein
VVAPAAAVLVVALVVLVNGLSPAEPPPRPYGRVVTTTCLLDQISLIRMARDYSPARAGDIEMVPRQPNFVAGPDGTITHEGPWTNLQKVPMFLLGPGYIKRGRTKFRTVTTAAVAPTIASLLNYTSRSWLPEEAPLAEGIRLKRPTRPPRLVLTMVWEGVGRDVLAKWPNSWPDLRRLQNNGTWYDKASAGSSPSAGSAIQTTIGTGVYPRTHGIVGDSFLLNGKVVPAHADGPSDLLVPTLADLYDRAQRGRPLVGLVGTDRAGLGLIGHGASFPGGDRDFVALHSASGPAGHWGLATASWARDYRVPRALESLGGLGTFNRRADALDGATDGRWEGARLSRLDGGFDTPAGADYETLALQRLIATEGFGRDVVPDLVFASYGLPQLVAQRYGMNSFQMRDTVETLDRELFVVRTFLNKTVGSHRWVLILTADHGSTPNPKVVGAFAIDPNELRRDLQQRFGGGPDKPSIVRAISPTQIWLNMHLLHARGFTTYDVSRFLLGYTIGDNRKGDVANAGERVFQAAFPTSLLPLLPCLGS